MGVRIPGGRHSRERVDARRDQPSQTQRGRVVSIFSSLRISMDSFGMDVTSFRVEGRPGRGQLTSLLLRAGCPGR